MCLRRTHSGKALGKLAYVTGVRSCSVRDTGEKNNVKKRASEKKVCATFLELEIIWFGYIGEWLDISRIKAVKFLTTPKSWISL